MVITMSRTMNKESVEKASVSGVPCTSFFFTPNRSLYLGESLQVSAAPSHWKESCVNSECTLHQLSPYIGKLKSSIAHDLLKTYSKPGDLVVDPFSGSGTIPLEALLLGRRVFAADVSPYAKLLTRAKLGAPYSQDVALSKAENLIERAMKLPPPNLGDVPPWIREFFHDDTLKEAIRFSRVCGRSKNAFLMGCFLGILHHQRPGFLSYPSSHLVPYLRDKKYPCDTFPHLYEYRELRPRLLAKVKRAFKRRGSVKHEVDWTFRQSQIENLTFPKPFDCLITSPPYMNTLDYGRDNRLRLWFIEPAERRTGDNPATRQKKAFQHAIASLAVKVERHLKVGGHCILIVGERVFRTYSAELSEVICGIMREKAPSVKLMSIIKDDIPDIRRARKGCGGTKTEHMLVFKRS